MSFCGVNVYALHANDFVEVKWIVPMVTSDEDELTYRIELIQNDWNWDQLLEKAGWSEDQIHPYPILRRPYRVMDDGILIDAGSEEVDRIFEERERALRHLSLFSGLYVDSFKQMTLQILKFLRPEWVGTISFLPSVEFQEPTAMNHIYWEQGQDLEAELIYQDYVIDFSNGLPIQYQISYHYEWFGFATPCVSVTKEYDKQHECIKVPVQNRAEAMYWISREVERLKKGEFTYA